MHHLERSYKIDTHYEGIVSSNRYGPFAVELSKVDRQKEFNDIKAKLNEQDLTIHQMLYLASRLVLCAEAQIEKDNPS